MPLTYSVQAEVIDITQDVPQAGDIFFVDTNIWYWATYPNADSFSLSDRSRPNPYQIDHYPNYLQGTVVAGSLLYCSGLSLSELAHRIESAEYEIFRSEHLKNQKLSLKSFRRNYSAQRNQVVAEVLSAWSQVTSLANVLDLNVDNSTTNAALSRFETQLIDGYDLFILETMKAHSITKVITDDGDYATVPGIQVFTANQAAIKAADKRGKLLSRQA